MTTKTVDLNMSHLPAACRVETFAADAQSELEAVEELLDSLWKDLSELERMHGIALLNKRTFDPITHLVTLARRNTEKVQEASAELPAPTVASFKQAAE